jgi:hypothetical protein
MMIATNGTPDMLSLLWLALPQIKQLDNLLRNEQVLLRTFAKVISPF